MATQTEPNAWKDLKMGEKCRLIPLCNHSFHSECVDSWFLRNPICPVCRTGGRFLVTCFYKNANEVEDNAVRDDI
ncbi:hypothetical protein Goari_025062 [Gossypium aridum]|uniref:RING-type E3 ubiquitin transferase n=1 Tax=Gossypium aridum TaxID=34290 RepID=A0A7J8X8H5_GOSAI|nr:hypothetical protein [Gossypium aridum]